MSDQDNSSTEGVSISVGGYNPSPERMANYGATTPGATRSAEQDLAEFAKLGTQNTPAPQSNAQTAQPGAKFDTQAHAAKQVALYKQDYVDGKLDGPLKNLYREMMMHAADPANYPAPAEMTNMQSGDKRVTEGNLTGITHQQMISADVDHLARQLADVRGHVAEGVNAAAAQADDGRAIAETVAGLGLDKTVGLALGQVFQQHMAAHGGADGIQVQPGEMQAFMDKAVERFGSHEAFAEASQNAREALQSMPSPVPGFQSALQWADHSKLTTSTLAWDRRVLSMLTMGAKFTGGQ